jgi:hypothetical protein
VFALTVKGKTSYWNVPPRFAWRDGRGGRRHMVHSYRELMFPDRYGMEGGTLGGNWDTYQCFSRWSCK